MRRYPGGDPDRSRSVLKKAVHSRAAAFRASTTVPARFYVLSSAMSLVTLTVARSSIDAQLRVVTSRAGLGDERGVPHSRALLGGEILRQRRREQIDPRLAIRDRTEGEGSAIGRETERRRRTEGTSQRQQFARGPRRPTASRPRHGSGKPGLCHPARNPDHQRGGVARQAVEHLQRVYIPQLDHAAGRCRAGGQDGRVG